MRRIPGLSTEIAARAASLSTKASESRRTVQQAAPGLVPPSASIAPAKVADGVATLRLYDYIDGDGGYWGISADEFAAALDDAGSVDNIVLRINSGGGAVWDGLAILNVLRDHAASVTAVVDGIAASAASFIAVACDEVVMMPNSRMMIHDALGICIGQAVDMHEYGAFLSDTSDNIAAIYAERAGGTVEQWRETMTAKGLLGQWYTAQEAVDAGLADKVGGQADPEDRAAAASSTPDDTTPTKGDDDTAANQKAAAMRARNRAHRNELAAARHGLGTTAA